MEEEDNLTVEPAPPKYVDQWARQNAIQKSHDENMQANVALIGQLAELTSAIHRLAKALEEREKGW